MLESGWIVSTPMNMSLEVPGGKEHLQLRRSSDVFPASFLDIRKNSTGGHYAVSLYEPPSPGFGGPLSNSVSSPPSPGMPVSPTNITFTTPNYSQGLQPPTSSPQPRQQRTSPQIRLSRSVNNLKAAGMVNVTAVTFDPNEPLPGHSSLNADDAQKSKGFFDRLMPKKKESRSYLREQERRNSDTPAILGSRKKSVAAQRNNFYAEPSSNVRPLLQKPKPRNEVFTLVNKAPAVPTILPNVIAKQTPLVRPPVRAPIRAPVYTAPPKSSASSSGSLESNAITIDDSDSESDTSSAFREPLMDMDAVYGISEFSPVVCDPSSSLDNIQDSHDFPVIQIGPVPSKTTSYYKRFHQREQRRLSILEPPIDVQFKKGEHGIMGIAKRKSFLGSL
ncbi:hypothetical protein BJ508DRAFT_414024 [Ascobolus immersus RN42]|uniref:Uncharacterized protein n=1 Tax=Ascobolus immersus RN42 TaxID=1160509 RepID=A0A3N4IEG7_ASCIM|nr:hypothetical protein BJ508DRAFT_414024 [Ascobolus immersus RN42]